MTRLVRVELLKLATMRVTYGLLASSVAVTALFATLTATVGGRGSAPISTAAGFHSLTTETGVAMILAAVLGVILTSGEHRHTSATLTYLAAPRRARVLAAKAVATSAVGACYGLAAGVAATGIGLVFVAARGDHVTLGGAALVGHVVGAGVGAGLLGALGVAVGSLVRSQLAGVIGVFVWCLVVESVLGANVPSVRPYLPYTAATTLGGARLGAAAFGPGYGISAQQALPFVGAAALVCAIIVAVSLVAERTTLRHDIT